MKRTLTVAALLAAAMLDLHAQGVEYAGVKINEDGRSARTYVAREGARLIDDTELTYSAGWTFERLLNRNLGLFCNTRSISGDAPARASYTLCNCSEVTLYGELPQGASADIYIDGKLASSVRSAADGVLFSSGSLTPGEHRITVKTAGKGVGIDFLECITEGNDPYVIDSENRSFVYHTGGFSVTPSFTGPSIHSTDGEGEIMEVYFHGPSIRCYGVKAPDGGSLTLYANGTKVKNVSLKAPKHTDDALLFTLDGLKPDEFNSIRIVTGRGKLTINYFTVDDPACLMVDMNRRTDIELEQMKNHLRSAYDPSTWTPAHFSAEVPVSGVTLKDGVFNTVFNRNIQYLKDCLALPNWVDAKDQDRIWIDMLYASNEGRMLGGMGHTLRFREVPEFHKAIEDILEQVDRRQFANGNGYLMPYGHETYNISKDTWPGVMRDEQKNYDRAMFTKGMLAAGLAGHQRGYTLLRPFYDWFNSAEQYLPNMLLGSMGIQGAIAGPMVYHSPVGVPADVITNIKYYNMDWWLDALSKRLPEAAWRYTLNRPHNYLLTAVCSVFDVYMATGEQRLLDASLGAWDIYRDYFQIPGGGISLCEHFECRPWTYKLTNLPNNIYETCGSVFWIDLNHRFLQLWPDREDYAAEIERSLYNVVIPAQGEDGKIRYFNQFNEGKYPPLCYNTCCEIQATALYGMMPQYIYSLTPDGIYINLYAASDIDFNLGDDSVRLTMDTAFPADGKVCLKVETQKAKQFKLRLRIPAWTKGKVKLMLNGKTVASGTPGTYLALDREWQDGDTLDFALPMSLRCEKYIGENRIEGADRYAILYGPLLMAVTGPMMEDVLQAPGEHSVKFDMTVGDFMGRLKPAGEPGVFSVEGYPQYTLRPYYSFQDGSFTCFPGFNKN